MSSLSTGGQAGQATTTWSYDPALGLPAHKSIAGSNVLNLSYHPDGRIDTLSRNLNNSLAVKSHLYTDDAHKYFRGYSWEDGGLTPAVAITAFQTGGVPENIVTAGVCSLNYDHNPDYQITAVKLTNAVVADKAVNYGYNADLRRETMSVGGRAVGYEYQDGRLWKVSAGALVAEYEYEPGSLSLVKKVTVKKDGSVVFVRDTEWQDATDRIESVTNRGGGGSVHRSFEYTRDPHTAQIVRTHREDGSAWKYAYDDCGQLRQAERTGTASGTQYAFTSDSITNLLSAGPRRRIDGKPGTRYQPDIFNRIEARMVGTTLEISGSAIPEATVSVNNVKASRQGSGFLVSLDADNQLGPACRQVGITATLYDPLEVPEVGGGPAPSLELHSSPGK